MAITASSLGAVILDRNLLRSDARIRLRGGFGKCILKSLQDAIRVHTQFGETWPDVAKVRLKQGVHAEPVFVFAKVIGESEPTGAFAVFVEGAANASE